MEKYKQLSLEERSVIQAQLTLGFKPSWIAVARKIGVRPRFFVCEIYLIVVQQQSIIRVK